MSRRSYKQHDVATLMVLLGRCDGLDETDLLTGAISAIAARLDVECTNVQARHLRSVLVEILYEALDY